MKAKSSNTPRAQPDYLKLGYEFSFSQGLKVVLFDRQSTEDSKTLMSRLLSGFMKWSAGNWIIHHIKKQLPNERIASEFIKNIEKQGGVSRDELIDFINELKIKKSGQALSFPAASLRGKNDISLSNSDEILKDHLIGSPSNSQAVNKFSRENISEFLLFSKKCKIKNPTDKAKIENLVSFIKAFDEERKNNYSFFILRNYRRVEFAKRELEMLWKAVPTKNKTAVADARDRENEYRSKLKMMPSVIRELIKHNENRINAEYIHRKIRNEEDSDQEPKFELAVKSLKMINSREFIHYFNLGFIDDRSFNYLSDLVKEYKEKKSILRSVIAKEFANKDPLYTEILDQIINQLEQDLKERGTASI